MESLYPRIGNFHRSNPIANKFILDPRVLTILAQLIREEPLAMQSVYYFKPPSSRGLYLHQDNNEIFAYPGTCYAAWTSIDGSDRENGGLFLVPGSHKLSLLQPREVDKNLNPYGYTNHIPLGYKAIDLETKPGDVVFFGGNMLHGSHNNLSSHRFRAAFAAHYVGTSVEMLTMYRNELINRHGEKVRRKYNANRLTIN
jgi:phytanoyl-CoA hydroxylase